MKLIIDRSRIPKDEAFRPRFKTLLDWLKDPEIAGAENIQIVEAPYDGPNSLIVESEFRIDGFKLHRTSGYELSILHTEDHEIREAIVSFEKVFDRAIAAGATKPSVLNSVEKRFRGIDQ